MSFKFYEFFAGGGMARAGLGAGWQCLFANDFDRMKAQTYAANWGGDHFICEDVALIRPDQLPGYANLIWASFPCQDLSLAGSYKGLGSAASDVMTRSGTFWPFWSLVSSLKKLGRAPQLVVLENVVGTLTSRGGEDFAAICNALSQQNYKFGTVVIDAKHFVPQSRQRVFFIAISSEIVIPDYLLHDEAISPWHPSALILAQNRLDDSVKDNWLWWRIPTPPTRDSVFADLIEDSPKDCKWHTQIETDRLLSMMSSVNIAKVNQAKISGKRSVGAVYKRTRIERGQKRIRAEIRFDDLAGCLRTPGGGSSRQTILIVEGDQIRSRLLSSREAARLMGLDDSYKMPIRYNDAYHVAGDGVCVPVVRHIACEILEPILNHQYATLEAAE